MTATTIQTQYINCNPDELPRDLFYDHDGKVVSIEFEGIYEHPEHPGVADWCVRHYIITLPEGHITCGAVSNNAMTHYEGSDSFNETVEEYGIGAN